MLESHVLRRPNRYFQTNQGTTRYQVFGEGNAPTVVMVHSFNGFLETWDPNVQALVRAGYRVVVYDLFGRGLSDRPRVDYDLAVFRQQLADVVRESGAARVHLVGSSFGCVIAADYALHHPDAVESLVFVGPAGWPLDTNRSPLIDVPLVADVAFHYFGHAILEPKVKEYLVDPDRFGDWIEQWRQYANMPGFTRAALSTLRHAPVFDYSEGWQQFGALNKPTLVLWGKEDVSFPYSNAASVSERIPHADVIGIDGAAHWVNIEQAQRVNQAIYSFLKSI